MIGVIRRMFGSAEQGDKLVDSAIGGLDKAFFTKEERADASRELSEWYLRYLEATQPQNIARRYIAMLVVWLWVVLVIATAFASIAASFGLPGADDAASRLMALLVDVVLQPFSIILGFYFLTHTVRAYRKGAE